MADKPIECSGCQKKGCTIFKRLSNDQIFSYFVCEECPILKERLGFFIETKEEKGVSFDEESTCRFCQCCLKNLADHNHSGCPECYSAFDSWILHTLKKAKKIPEKLFELLQGERKVQLHVGKSPNRHLKEEELVCLEELSQALDDAIAKENYELAALLRDQIQKLKHTAYGSTSTSE